jgi:ribosomal protein S18 acetylase RimI-like enzyme
VITRITEKYYCDIIKDIADYWEGDDSERLKRIRILHHPFMIHEFGDCAFALLKNERIAAYIMGLFASSSPLAYVHMIAVHSDERRMGYGRTLYDHFEQLAREKGCTHLKAITSTGNEASIKFHISIGMELQGSENANGIPVIKDYAGYGEDRVVFLKKI